MKTSRFFLFIGLLGLLAINTNAQSFITNGLVDYYPFKGNANDVVGTNNGVIYGGVTLAADRFGSNNSAYAFNGVDGYIDIGNPIGNSPTDFTETAWVDVISRETNGIIAEDVIITKRQAGFAGESWADLTVESKAPDAGSGEIIIDGDDYFAQYFGTTINPTNSWVFLCEVCSNGNYQLYVNGSLQNAFSNPRLLSSPEHMYLMHEEAWGTFCHGLLDDVRIYNRALASNEVEQLYDIEAPPQAATATATLVNGFVVGASIIDGGIGYTNTPLVHFIGGGGSGAEAVAVVSNGVVTAIDVLLTGSDYTNAPLVVVDPPVIPNPVLDIAPLSLLAFTNLVPGQGYQLQQFQSWYWTNLTAGFTASNNIYAYPSGNGVYRLALSPVAAQAFATPEVVNGFVVGATVSAGGSGYVTAPFVNIVGAGGTNATAVASINDGVVTNITVMDAGYGYTSSVTIEIEPPPATAQSPIILPGIQLNASSLIPYESYQLQLEPTLGSAWENWSGGLFNSSGTVSSQYIYLTNSAGFFRLEHVP